MSSASIAERIRWTLRHEGPGALLGKVFRRLTNPRLFKKEGSYDFVKFRPSVDQLRVVHARLEAVESPPVLSVILPVYNPKLEFLREAVESVRNQSYRNWELCIADDASTNQEIKRYLEQIAGQDDRIKVHFRETNGHISKASNSALNLASGDFIALLDHDDVLPGYALLLVADLLVRYPDTDVVYSNEDKIDSAGKHSEPRFKPSWSPEYFLSFMYIGHLTVHRTSLVKEVGGFREGFEGSQDFDLALRVTEKTSKIRHIPEIMYHWRMHGDSVAGNIKAKPYAFTAAKKALLCALERRGHADCSVEDTKQPGIYRPVFSLPSNSPSILVAIQLSEIDFSEDRLKQIVSSTECSNLRWVFIPEGQNLESMRFQRLFVLVERLRQSSGLDVEVAECNDARLGISALVPQISKSEIDYLCSVSSRLVPKKKSWILELLRHASRSGVGLVGGHITTPAGDHVHAGYVIAGDKIYHHLYGTHHAEAGYGARLTTVNNVSAVSTMCMMTRFENLEQSIAVRKQWESVRAFDVALALELAEQGKRHVFTPFASFVLAGEALAKVTNLSNYPEDAYLLDTEFGLQAFQDSYYPKGLNLNPPDYSWDMKEISLKAHLSSPGREDLRKHRDASVQPRGIAA